MKLREIGFSNKGELHYMMVDEVSLRDAIFPLEVVYYLEKHGIREIGVEFEFDRADRATYANINFRMHGMDWQSSGFALCCKDDVYDEMIGSEIALLRALMDVIDTIRVMAD